MIEARDLSELMAEVGEQLDNDVAEAASCIINEGLLIKALEGFAPLKDDRFSMEVLAGMLLSCLSDMEDIDVGRAVELRLLFGKLWRIGKPAAECHFRGPTPKA